MIRELIVRAAHRWQHLGDWLWELGLDAAPRRTRAAAEEAWAAILRDRRTPPYGANLIFGAFARQASEPQTVESAEGAEKIK